jgi:hypothetical protein
VGSERLRRFLKLERARPGGAGPVDPLPDDGRFEHIGEEPAPAPATPIPQEATDRFRPAPERPLQTAALPAGAQPFTRCVRCQADSTVYAERCQGCGAPLDTPEQRAFNERLWADRVAALEEERRMLAGREAQRRDEAEERARVRREAEEETARAVKARVEAELDAGGLGGGEGSVREGDRPGRLAERWRVAAVAFVVVAVTLAVAAPRRGAWAAMGSIGILLAVATALWRRARGR